MSDNSIEVRRAAWRARAKQNYKKNGGKHQKAYHKRTYKRRPKLNPCLSAKHAKELIANYKLSIGRCVLHEFYNDGQQYYCVADNLVAFCFDHIDRATKFATISQMVGQATRQQLIDEMQKCWLLCANCHQLKTYENKDYLPIIKIEKQRNELTLFE